MKHYLLSFSRYPLLAFITCLLFLLLVATPAHGTDSGSNEGEGRLTSVSDFKIGITTIYSPDSFYAWGKIRNSSSFSVRGQIWHSSIRYNKLTARIGTELILTHRLSFPIDGYNGPRDIRTGFGVIPVSLMMPIQMTSNVTPFALVSAGGIFLNDKLPESSGASLNYLVNIGLGLEFKATDRLDLQVGYSIQHMSNANTGNENPGIDSHMFFLTFLF